MKKDRIKKRYSGGADSCTLISPPQSYDYWKLEDKKLRVAVYCRVATQEHVNFPEKELIASTVYPDVAGGSHEEG